MLFVIIVPTKTKTLMTRQAKANSLITVFEQLEKLCDSHNLLLATKRQNSDYNLTAPLTDRCLNAGTNATQ